jgi:hypothetical protein
VKDGSPLLTAIKLGCKDLARDSITRPYRTALTTYFVGILPKKVAALQQRLDAVDIKCSVTQSPNNDTNQRNFRERKDGWLLVIPKDARLCKTTSLNEGTADVGTNCTDEWRMKNLK